MKLERRRQVLVDRRFQLGLVLRLGGVLLLNWMLFCALLLLAPATFAMVSGTPEWEILKLAAQPVLLLRVIIVPLVGTLLCLFGQGVYETFRIAGPTYRFRAVFRDLAALRIPSGVRIRQKDHLQNTAAALDSSLGTLHQKISQLKALGDTARHSLSEAKTAGEDSGPALRESVRCLEQIVDSLDDFTLAGEAPDVVEPMESTVGTGNPEHPEHTGSTDRTEQDAVEPVEEQPQAPVSC